MKAHVIFDKQVLIGITQCSMAIDVASKLMPEADSFEIHKFIFNNPVIANEGEIVEVVAEVEKNGEEYSAIHEFRSNNSDVYTRSASYSITKNVNLKNSVLDINMLKENCLKETDKQYINERWMLNRPTILRAIDNICIGSSCAVGKFSLNGTIENKTYHYTIAPSFIDGGFITSASLLPDKITMEDDKNGMYIPFMVKSIRVKGRLDKSGYCVGKVKKYNDSILELDFSLCCDDGSVVAEVEGFSMKYTLKNAFYDQKSSAAIITEMESTEYPVKNMISDMSKEISDYLKKHIAEMLNTEYSKVSSEKNFMELGLDSNYLISLASKIEAEIGIELYPTLFFEYQNISLVTAYFTEQFSNEFKEYFSIGQTSNTSERVMPVSAKTDKGDIRYKFTYFLKEKVAQMLGRNSSEISTEKNFMELGLDSNSLISFASTLENEFKIELYPTLFFEYQNIASVVEFFEMEYGDVITQFFKENQSSLYDTEHLISEEMEEATEEVTEIIDFADNKNCNCEDIAIIGMAARYAKSDNLSEFWNNIISGTDFVSEVPKDHWDYKCSFDSNRDSAGKNYCKWGSFIEVDKFDADYFGISPREAKWMDPQLRLFLEVAQETIDDANYGKKIYGSETGVFVGSGLKEYWENIVREKTKIVDYQANSAVFSSLSGRVSYTFDLQGPSMVVDTACSSSLSALHLACSAIRNGDCKMALVGGLNLLISDLHYIYVSRMQALSPTGRCHSFDKDADGYVPGEGICSVLLKPLDQAIKDCDQIYAVIKNTSVNHVGRSNNPTSPKVDAETKLLLSACEKSGISPETISYIEAHGTGTLLGDPIEIEALKKAFSGNTTKKTFLLHWFDQITFWPFRRSGRPYRCNKNCSFYEEPNDTCDASVS